MMSISKGLQSGVFRAGLVFAFTASISLTGAPVHAQARVQPVARGTSAADTLTAVSAALDKYKAAGDDKLFENLAKIATGLGHVGTAVGFLVTVAELAGVVQSSEDMILSAVKVVEEKVDLSRQENLSYFNSVKENANIQAALGDLDYQTLTTYESRIANYMKDASRINNVLTQIDTSQVLKIAQAARDACMGSVIRPEILTSLANENLNLEPMLRYGALFLDIIDRAKTLEYATELTIRSDKLRNGTLDTSQGTTYTELETKLQGELSEYDSLTDQCQTSFTAISKKLSTDAQTVVWANEYYKQERVAQNLTVSSSAAELVNSLAKHFTYLDWMGVQYTKAHPGSALDDAAFSFSAPADRFILLGDPDDLKAFPPKGFPKTYLTFLPKDPQLQYGARAWSTDAALQFPDLAGADQQSCSYFVQNVRWHRDVGTRLTYYWNATTGNSRDITATALVATSDLINGLAPCKTVADIWWMFNNENTTNGPLNTPAVFATSAAQGGPSDPVLYQHGAAYDSFVVFKTAAPESDAYQRISDKDIETASYFLINQGTGDYIAAWAGAPYTTMTKGFMQGWLFESADSGYFYIRSTTNGQYLGYSPTFPSIPASPGVPSNQPLFTANVRMYPVDTAGSAASLSPFQWKIVLLTNGLHAITNRGKPGFALNEKQLDAALAKPGIYKQWLDYGQEGMGRSIAEWNLRFFGWRLSKQMIVSSHDPSLAINAWKGATLGAELRLSATCTPTNPDCTWTLLPNGMIVNDHDPNLAINAWNGARNGGELKLNTCSPTNPDCTWTMSNGMILSDRDPTLGFDANGGTNGAQLTLKPACSLSKPECHYWMTK